MEKIFLVSLLLLTVTRTQYYRSGTIIKNGMTAGLEHFFIIIILMFCEHQSYLLD